MACFGLLVDFVEKERGFDCHIDWDYDKLHQNAKKTGMELYTWWKYGRAEECSRADTQEPFSLRWLRLLKKDQTQLERLIKIRGFLWT